MGPLKHGGLALASTLSAFGNMLMLIWFLRRKTGPFGGSAIMKTGFKSLAGSIPMAVAVWYACSLIDWSQEGQKLIKGSVLGGAIIFGTCIYMIAVRLLRTEEAMDAVALLKRKLGKG
jgi:putative peptidoglycan lipid II flippase